VCSGISGRSSTINNSAFEPEQAKRRVVGVF
jgi:hypothetical protein